MSKHPEFIVALDLVASDELSFFVKAMEETDLFSALSRVEESIRQQPGRVYIANLFQRIPGRNPIYQVVLMSRVSGQDPTAITWHQRTKNNGENEWGRATWIPTDDDRHGILEFEDGGTLSTK